MVNNSKFLKYILITFCNILAFFIIYFGIYTYQLFLYDWQFFGCKKIASCTQVENHFSFSCPEMDYFYIKLFSKNKISGFIELSDLENGTYKFPFNNKYRVAVPNTFFVDQGGGLVNEHFALLLKSKNIYKLRIFFTNTLSPDVDVYINGSYRKKNFNSYNHFKLRSENNFNSETQEKLSKK